MVAIVNISTCTFVMPPAIANYCTSAQIKLVIDQRSFVRVKVKKPLGVVYSDSA